MAYNRLVRLALCFGLLHACFVQASDVPQQTTGFTRFLRQIVVATIPQKVSKREIGVTASIATVGFLGFLGYHYYKPAPTTNEVLIHEINRIALETENLKRIKENMGHHAQLVMVTTSPDRKTIIEEKVITPSGSVFFPLGITDIKSGELIQGQIAVLLAQGIVERARNKGKSLENSFALPMGKGSVNEEDGHYFYKYTWQGDENGINHITQIISGKTSHCIIGEPQEFGPNSDLVIAVNAYHTLQQSELTSWQKTRWQTDAEGNPIKWTAEQQKALKDPTAYAQQMAAVAENEKRSLQRNESILSKILGIFKKTPYTKALENSHFWLSQKNKRTQIDSITNRLKRNSHVYACDDSLTRKKALEIFAAAKECDACKECAAKAPPIYFYRVADTSKQKKWQKREIAAKARLQDILLGTNISSEELRNLFLPSNILPSL